MSAFILALDQGTTSSRAILFDAAGRPVATAQQEIAQHYPQPGWVEHDPLEIWQSQWDTALEVLRESRVSARDIAAIGISNQRETTLLWDRASGRPLHPAIVWQCRRTEPLCQRLRSTGFDQEIRRRTGLVTDAYFSATKLAWLLQHVPDARRRAEAGELAFGTVDSWLIWQLTAGRVHATDVSNASRTMLWNIHEGDWDELILRELDIPRALLPEVRSSCGDFGESHLFGSPLPIAGVLGDQQAATFGQGCFAPGQAKNTYGTGCFLMMNTGTEPVVSERGLLTTVGWRTGQDQELIYALEGGIFVAGAVVQWLRDELGIIRQSADIEALAAAVPDSGGVFVVPAFVGLGAPWWDPQARGAVLGLSRGSNRHHLARAALESIALQTVDVLEAMAADSGVRLQSLRVDGGATANNLLMQIQADLLGIPVERPACTELTALGAARVAGVGTGFWRFDDLARGEPEERVFEPGMSDDQRQSLLAGWHRAVSRSRGWAEEEAPSGGGT